MGSSLHDHGLIGLLHGVLLYALGVCSCSPFSSSGIWKERKKAVPDFGSLSTRICPWYRLTNSRIRDRPMPCPSPLVETLGSKDEGEQFG